MPAALLQRPLFLTASFCVPADAIFKAIRTEKIKIYYLQEFIVPPGWLTTYRYRFCIFVYMQLFIASLNSGSNGNCYYVGNEREAVLIDAGISCRETEKRIARLGLSMQRVKAIFVSHEHSDHTNGIPVLAKKYNLPVYITQGTLSNSRIKYDVLQFAGFCAYQPVQIGALQITGFPKFHDAADAHSFIVRCGDYTAGVFTDIGAPCEHVTAHFSLCHAAILEANYCDEMLEKGRYPYHLKQRIKSDKGHLSNLQALQLFKEHKPPFMNQLLLGHLSKDNNSPALVKKLFAEHAGDTEIIIASRFAESKLYCVSRRQPVQMSLW